MSGREKFGIALMILSAPQLLAFSWASGFSAVVFTLGWMMFSWEAK